MIKSRRSAINNKQTRRSSKPDFDKNAVYKEHIYSNEDFAKINNFCNKITDNDMFLDPKASGRGSFVISNDDPIIPIICNNKFIEKVRKLTGNNKLRPCLYIPIEYRKYIVGAKMDWHIDTQILDDQPQYECVITISNTSDSLTQMKVKTGIKTLKTKENSLLVVRANGVSHQVTKVNKGVRTIIKMVFYE